MDPNKKSEFTMPNEQSTILREESEKTFRQSNPTKEECEDWNDWQNLQDDVK